MSQRSPCRTNGADSSHARGWSPAAVPEAPEFSQAAKARLQSTRASCSIFHHSSRESASSGAFLTAMKPPLDMFLMTTATSLSSGRSMDVTIDVATAVCASGSASS